MSYTTPYSATLAEGEYTLTFPATFEHEGKTFSFDNWGDLPTGDTQKKNRARLITVTLDTDISVYAVYVSPTSGKGALAIVLASLFLLGLLALGGGD